MVAIKKPVLDLPITKDAVNPIAAHNKTVNPTNLHGQLGLGDTNRTIKTTNTHRIELTINVGKKLRRCKRVVILALFWLK